jgi:hypothetical protein
VHDAVAVQARERDHVEGLHLRQEEQRQEAQQHHRRAEQREQEELDRRVLAVRAAPHPIMKNIGSSTISKKTKKQDQVWRDERAVHARLRGCSTRRGTPSVVRLGKWFHE